MDYKIIVLDLDGTLTNRDKIITPRTKEALMKAQEAGKIVVLASGRPTAGVEPLAKELDLARFGSYILSYNGGMITNYPVDVARQMGADIIIGVDVQEGLVGAATLNTLADITGQIINLMGVEKYNENVQNSDVHIHVNVKGYSSASFNEQAIQVLLERGELAARRNCNRMGRTFSR